jgi:hypothetical protein
MADRLRKGWWNATAVHHWNEVWESSLQNHGRATADRYDPIPITIGTATHATPKGCDTLSRRAGSGAGKRS